jgi:hypothetical protein
MKVYGEGFVAGLVICLGATETGLTLMTKGTRGGNETIGRSFEPSL